MSAAVLESHPAYPGLFYFRSSHVDEVWLNSFGAVMDAATLETLIHLPILHQILAGIAGSAVTAVGAWPTTSSAAVSSGPPP